MIDAILQIQEGRIPTKRRLRKASTVNEEGRKLGIRERKAPKFVRKLKGAGQKIFVKGFTYKDKKTGKRVKVKGHFRTTSSGKLGMATSLCRFYKADPKKDNTEPHEFDFRYAGKKASQQGLKSSARRTHRGYENERHQFISWIKVHLI